MRQPDRNLVRDVIVHPQPSFLPSSDDNIVTAYGELLGRFVRNRPVRMAERPPPIDRRRLTNYLNKGGSLKRLRRHEYTDCRVGMGGDVPSEAEINMAKVARRAAWKWQKADTKDSQLKRAFR